MRIQLSRKHECCACVDECTVAVILLRVDSESHADQAGRLYAPLRVTRPRVVFLQHDFWIMIWTSAPLKHSRYEALEAALAAFGKGVSARRLHWWMYTHELGHDKQSGWEICGWILGILVGIWDGVHCWHRAGQGSQGEVPDLCTPMLSRWLATQLAR